MHHSSSLTWTASNVQSLVIREARGQKGELSKGGLKDPNFYSQERRRLKSDITEVFKLLGGEGGSHQRQVPEGYRGQNGKKWCKNEPCLL